MKQIELTQGYFALVDDDDFDYLNRFWWTVTNTEHVYAVSRMGGSDLFYMHKVILGLGSEDRCDHKNRNTLDNQKHNLRRATTQQNNCNAPKPQGPNGSGFRGVDRRENGKFRASIRVNRKKINLGTFDTAEEAARAYDIGAMLHHGEFALLNFEE